MPKTYRTVGPHSRLLHRSSLDGRSREGRFLRETEARLFEHLGGPDKVSITQRLVVTRLATVCLRLALFDEKIASGTTTDHDARVYGALHNAFRLLVRELGLKGHAPKPPSLADYLAVTYYGQPDGDRTAEASP